MDLNYLRRLLKIFDESSATELNIEEEGVSVQMSKATQQQAGMMQPTYIMGGQPSAAPAAQVAPAASTPATAPVVTPAANAEESMHKLLSPIVGTFYRAPSPDADSFVQVGQHVSVGETLCIVEAMKLMNEIESDVTGTIMKILVENTHPVEYNQPMFLIKPD
ncbi:MAG: acetyl-CoA carboxylase biotin carboxyl carrier protein [Candidatus Kapabacteria bacterium]|nr:acetyl-CoA carboxylase biotin carboxyl carrier protein [Candidatus Kapabacteria bacterium]